MYDIYGGASMNNPFSTTFGIEPQETISRQYEFKEIEDDFNRELPSSKVCLITGVRGSGKTLSMIKLKNKFDEDSDWITVELNSSAPDLLGQLLSKLYEIPYLSKLFVEAKINLSFFGIGIEIENTTPILQTSTALEKMLKVIKKKNKKVLIFIDEVISNQDMKVFTSTFQILIKNNLPLYLIMTGLPQNIDILQNEDTLTFLYRAPKIALMGLDLIEIANSYEKVLKVDHQRANELSKMTNGYAFAYQVLGYILFENKDMKHQELLNRYDSYLNERSYKKIWVELTTKEKEVVKAISKGKTKIKDIREYTKMGSSEMSTYRQRLNTKGIVDASQYGSLSFTLPRFGEIVSEWY